LVTANQWTHFAVVRSNNNLKLFVNGTKEIDVPLTGILTNSVNDLSIGANMDGLSDYIGYIDEVRISK